MIPWPAATTNSPGLWAPPNPPGLLRRGEGGVRYTYYRADVLTKLPSPWPSPEGEDSPTASRHPLSEGEFLQNSCIIAWSVLVGWVILRSIINKVLEETLLLWKIALSLKHPKQNEKTWTRRTYALGVSLYPFLRGKDRDSL